VAGGGQQLLEYCDYVSVRIDVCGLVALVLLTGDHRRGRRDAVPSTGSVGSSVQAAGSTEVVAAMPCGPWLKSRIRNLRLALRRPA
jgi:hypothetical protein